MTNLPFYELEIDKILVQIDSQPLLLTATGPSGESYIGLIVIESDDRIVDYWIYARTPKIIIDSIADKRTPLLDGFTRSDELWLIRHDTKHDTHVIMPTSIEEIPEDWLPIAGATL